MLSKKFITSILAAAFMIALSASALADTIRLRDGTTIRGQIIAFKDQQFTVLIGAGTRGRRSRLTLNIEDVESIEFDSALSGGTQPATGAAGIGDVVGGPSGNGNTDTNDNTSPVVDNRPAPTISQPSTTTTGRTTTTTTSSGAPAFFPIRVRVRADNTNNGWTDSGLMVRAGQRLRINASGRVSLGNGVYATPTGLPRMADNDKLMRNEPTGALIAVIGDDNDDFIFVGANTEFVAKRDGRLFLGVNEGNLADNSGAYDVTVEAEALAGNR
ncbi:MAG: hypothetical protein DMF64_10670 [Acidobacteria bacterium]|nr:MAG: hypothetical protein DMF64_10670 [Acidobacteriota bacterium]